MCFKCGCCFTCGFTRIGICWWLIGIRYGCCQVCMFWFVIVGCKLWIHPCPGWLIVFTLWVWSSGLFLSQLRPTFWFALSTGWNCCGLWDFGCLLFMFVQPMYEKDWSYKFCFSFGFDPSWVPVCSHSSFLKLIFWSLKSQFLVEKNSELSWVKSSL